MNRPVCGVCMCLEDETGCGCEKHNDIGQYFDQMTGKTKEELWQLVKQLTIENQNMARELIKLSSKQIMKETDEYKLHPLRPSDYDEKYAKTDNVQISAITDNNFLPVSSDNRLMTVKEPYAYAYERIDGSAKVACGKMEYDPKVVKEIPLYTSPQYRELSDDEIEEIYYKDFNFEFADMIEFAKAILLKARTR